MKFLQDRKIAEAINNYDLSEPAETASAVFSEGFEKKMEKLIRSKQRRGGAARFTRFAVPAALCAALAFAAWQVVPLMIPDADGLSAGFETQPVEVTKPIPDQPAGTLILTDDEMYRDDGWELNGLKTWEEARQAASFALREPAVLPEGAELFSHHVSQKDFYPFVSSLYFLPQVHEPQEDHVGTGLFDIYMTLCQYYIGPNGIVELSDGAREIQTVMVGDTEVMWYTCHPMSDGVRHGDSSIMVHWIKNDVLFRLAADNYGSTVVTTLWPVLYGFTIDELMPTVESLITGTPHPLTLAPNPVFSDGELNMLMNYGLRTENGFKTWEEARQAAPFALREPTALPEGAELTLIEVSQQGINGSSPFVAALYLVPQEHNGEVWGSLLIALFQYHIGPNVKMVFDDGFEDKFITVGGIEVLCHTFDVSNIAKSEEYEGLEDSHILLHWEENEVIFRLFAVNYGGVIANDTPVGFTLDDLLPIAESLINAS